MRPSNDLDTVWLCRQAVDFRNYVERVIMRRLLVLD
jgi:hypothetical protein